jgi:hypothetical protein
MPKFREQYDQLLLQARRGRESKPSGIDQAHRFAEKARAERAKEAAA